MNSVGELVAGLDQRDAPLRRLARGELADRGGNFRAVGGTQAVVRRRWLVVLDVDTAFAQQRDADAVLGRIDHQRQVVFVRTGDRGLDQAGVDGVALD